VTRGARRVPSLRGRLDRAAIATVVLALSAVLGIVLSGVAQHRRLASATALVIEEQRIADEIVQGVMRQLVIVSAPPAERTAAQQASFDETGRRVYEGLRRYLFRELTPDERLLIEEVKAEHAQMETSANLAPAFAANDPAFARRVSEQSVQHALRLVSSLDAFVRVREAELEELVRRQTDALWRFGIGSVVALLVLAGALLVIESRFVERHVRSPLAALEAAAARLAAGDLEARVPTTGDAEFTAVGERFNQMAASLAAARAELEARHAELSRALDQVQTAQAELVTAEKLGAIGRMTAGLAHELNNPLASVLGFAELLASRLDDLPEPQAAALRDEFVQPMVREARRSRLLVRSLLQFARQGESELGPVAVGDALRIVLELRGFAFAQAGLTLHVHDVPEVAVVAERQNLQGVFLNIVNNALDVLAPRGRGRLAISGRTEGETVVLHFDDDGPGLADPSRIFEAFYTTKGVGEGTGLGLALTQRFMESFGGSVTAENRPEGGARFSLRFRRTREQPPPGRPLDTPQRAGALPLRASGSRETVLVVEDEPHLQRLHEKLLVRLNVEVLVCGTVAAAREAVASQRVHVIISDVKMPGESGLTFYEWIQREYPALADRFLFVTGDVGAPELVGIAAARPDAFLHKPFEGREYLARVGRLLGD
jgi:C4-dicarboxylate-specific signal transduction histidine kinase